MTAKALQTMLCLSSWRASMSIFNLSTAWVLAELSPSPMINSLLILPRSISAILPLQRSRRGLFFFTIAAILFEVVVIGMYFDFGNKAALIFLTFFSAQLASLGITKSDAVIIGFTQTSEGITNQQVLQGKDIGGVTGTFLGGIIYPAFKLLPPTLLLMLPVAWLADRENKKQSQASPNQTEIKKGVPPLERWSLLNGLVDGALFSLLPLWVLQIKGGDSVDLSWIIGSFMLGRVFQKRLLLKMKTDSYYGLCAILIFLAAHPNTPIWLDVVLFMPLGASIARIQLELVDHLQPYGNPARRFDIIGRSNTIAGVFGGLAMGVTGELFGIREALGLLAIAFAGVGLASWRWQRPVPSNQT